MDPERGRSPRLSGGGLDHDEAVIDMLRRPHLKSKSRQGLFETETEICPCRYHSHPDSIDVILRRRGQVIARTGDANRTLIPDVDHLGIVRENYTEFRALFGKASFRSVLRRLTSQAGHVVPLADLPSLAPRVIKRYLSLLEAAGAIEHTDEGVRLVPKMQPSGRAITIQDIGLTMEWYVAGVCERELGGSADWGVRLKGLPVNGDFDVLAWLQPTLVYIEIKTSPPGALSVVALREFLQRSQVLSPEVTILLIDTDDDIQPAVHGLLKAMWPVVRAREGGLRDWEPDDHLFRQSRDFPSVWEVHYAGVRILVASSEPSIPEQLRRCLRHYHAQVKGTLPFLGRLQHSS